MRTGVAALVGLPVGARPAVVGACGAGSAQPVGAGGVAVERGAPAIRAAARPRVVFGPASRAPRRGLDRRLPDLDLGHRQCRVRTEVERRWPSPGHDELGGEGRDHRAVVGAERQRRDADRHARGIRSLDRHIAQSLVRDDTAAEQQSRHAVVAAGGEGLGDEHVDDGLAEGCRDIRDGHLFARRFPLLDPPRDRGLEA